MYNIVTRHHSHKNHPFFSNIDSPSYVITIAAVFTVQLNGSGRPEICMTLPDFAEEELDL